MSDFKNEVKKGRENRQSWISRAFGLGGADEAKAQESGSQGQREDIRATIDRANDERAGKGMNLDNDKVKKFVEGFRRGK